MRKILAVICATGAVSFSGAGIANATVENNTAPSSTSITLADTDNNKAEKSDNSGLWGLAGLLGLAGLAGLRRRPANTGVVDPTVTRRPAV